MSPTNITAPSRKQSFKPFHTFSTSPGSFFPHQNSSRLNLLAEDGFCFSLFQFPDLAPFHMFHFTLPYSFLQVKDTYKQPVLFDAFYLDHLNIPDHFSFTFPGQSTAFSYVNNLLSLVLNHVPFKPARFNA